MRNCFYYVTLFSSICQSKEQSDCNREPPNTCCYNQYLNEDNKTCTECPYGSIGWNCKQPCPSGFYGRLCSSPCKCVASECHNVTGCVTTYDPQSGTTLTTDLTTHHSPLTIANVTGEVSTYQGVKSIRENLHIHYEDDHDFPLSTLGFSLLGSLSSLFAIGCVICIHSRKKKWMIRGSPSSSRIRQVLLPCVNQDRQQELIQGSGDIELSIVNAAPVCGQEEDDSPYSEIRHSQFIGGANAEGVCINTDSCLMHKCYSDKHHNTSEKQNIYQMSIDKNEYDHVNLKVKSSDMLSDRNLSLSHSNDEEYASVLNKQSLGKEIRPNDGLKCQNPTLPKNSTTDCNDMGKNESKHNCLLTEYNQRIQFEMEVKVDSSDKTKHNSEYTDRQIGSMSDNRPYSMAGCLSENNLNETVDESLDLQNINISKNLHLSVNDLSKVVENSVNPLDIDISGRRENASKRETIVRRTQDLIAL